MVLEREPGTPDYTMGYSEQVLQFYELHAAETSAAYLLPHLQPGFRVLDLGCGPGTVSVGLARAVEPGELHGVDMEQGQVDLARQTARACEQDNALFHIGDVTDLQFEDCSFDVVHCHNVLMHVPDTASVLREAKRVLRPGGLMACREMICGSCFFYPDFSGALIKCWEMFEDLLATNDGHPQMGKELKSHLHEAGYENIRVSGSLNTYSEPLELAFVDELVNNWFLSPQTMEVALKYGAATEEVCNRVRASYDQWKRQPGALCGMALGNAIASKPCP